MKLNCLILARAGLTESRLPSAGGGRIARRGPLDGAWQDGCDLVVPPNGYTMDMQADGCDIVLSLPAAYIDTAYSDDADFVIE